ncbi:MAG: thioredoxin family protein [Phycisphaerales bacterium]|jgi:thiol-disulfide isomerase/thioredoxin|nr:thioredoxin family protein [Phycisphaerales bacterium]
MTTTATAPLLDPTFLRSTFDAGLSYEDYVATGNPGQKSAWNDFHARVHLTGEQSRLIGSFSRRMPVLVSSGVWCGDCVQQVPMLDHIARANPGKIDLRIVDRDEHADLARRIMLAGGLRVPVVLFLNEDFDLMSLFGDRTLARYRALAARQLGASCPLPGAPVPPDEVAATLQDWVDEFERVALMLRLSTKLRQRHQD